MPFKNYHNYQFLFLDKKKKEKKNHIMLNFLVCCTGYRLVVNGEKKKNHLN